MFYQRSWVDGGGSSGDRAIVTLSQRAKGPYKDSELCCNGREGCCLFKSVYEPYEGRLLRTC